MRQRPRDAMGLVGIDAGLPVVVRLTWNSGVSAVLGFLWPGTVHFGAGHIAGCLFVMIAPLLLGAVASILAFSELAPYRRVGPDRGGTESAGGYSS